MIAMRPLHGKFTGKLTWTVMEGKKIPSQILKLLDVKNCLKDGLVVETLEKYDKIKAEEKTKALKDEKEGEKGRDKLIKDRKDKKSKKPEQEITAIEEAGEGDIES